MKGKFTKFRKLLCYVIISLFMFGIGGELVKADTITINSIEWLGNYQTARYAKFNVTLNGTTSRYAYCLDAPLDAPGAGNSLSTFNPNLSPETKLRMINVLLAAGYPSYNLNYTNGGKMSEADAFYVTQAALWYARYGSSARYRTFTPNFHSKMKNGTYGLGKYSAAYNKLISAADSKSAYQERDDSKITVNASNGNIMTQVENTNILASDSTFSIDGVNSYRVDVTGTNAYITSKDLSQNYGTSKTFGQGDEFRIAVDLGENPASGEYQASFNVTELDAPQKYDLAFFAGAWTGGFQSMTFLVPQGSTPIETSFNLKGKIETTDVSFAKVDGNGEYIAEADLAVYTSTGDLVSRFNSDTTPKTLKLENGDYYLEEIYNPGPYVINKNKVEFKVQNGSVTSGGNVISIVSISDEPAYITLKKVDIDGNPIEGATFVVYWRNKELTHNKYICGKTDSQGYLSQPSEKCNDIGNEYGTQNMLSSTGVYSLVDLEYVNWIANNQLYVKELEPTKGYLKDENVYAIHGPYGDSIGWYYNTEDLAGDAGDVIQIEKDGKTVTEFQFTNTRYINISKVDSDMGEEVPGATMQICRKVNKDEVNGACEVDTENKTVYLDYWISETKPHEFGGIKKGERYILEEVYAPEGYILFSGMLEFELQDDGKTVKMYNHETGEEISNPEELKAVMPNEPTTKVTISKVDAAGGQEIPGAHIKICTEASFNSALAVTGDGNNCESVDEWDSGTTPHTVSGLDYGDYRLIETIAPAGYYSKTSSTKFSLDINNKVKSITMENEVTKLTITKKDQVTGERIPGAKLQIIDVETGEIAKDYKGNELVWESKIDEDWVILGIPGGRNYKLIETIAPEGYQEGMIIDGQIVNEYEFYIGNKEGDINIELNLEVLNAPNTGISTLNLFAIGGLMVFAGYETIKIYRRKALNN